MRNDPGISEGDRFCRLVVRKEAGVFGSMRYWICECICGKPILATSSALKTQKIKSCGCLLKENGSKGTHGMWLSCEYRAWINMKRRCLNPKCPSYRHYGGRGIKVYKPWIRSFEKFFKEVGKRPSPQHSLGRINNDKGYIPRNVEWQTICRQKRNTRANRFLKVNGKRLIITDWAQQLGIHPTTLGSRLRRGWWMEKAVSKKW